MYEGESDRMQDESLPVDRPEPVIDYDADQIDVREVAEEDTPREGSLTDDEARRIANADLDNVLDEFVDLANGRDLDGLQKLFSPEIEADFLGEDSAEGVVEGLNDLMLRYPTLILTRADLGADPIVAVWAFDTAADRFDPFGYITLELGDSDEGLIQRIAYVEEFDDSDELVAETPERSDLPEWEDWSELDED